MGLLVEYSLNDGMAKAQIDALEALISGLKDLSDGGYHYTAYETDDPKRFIAVLEFDDDAAKQRFLDSAPFNTYRDGAKGRFTGPPQTTQIKLVASTRG